MAFPIAVQQILHRETPSCRRRTKLAVQRDAGKAPYRCIHDQTKGSGPARLLGIACCLLSKNLCGKLNLDVKAVWIRILALFAVAVLLANTQCYARCARGACGSASVPSNCHHRHTKSPEGDPGPCPLQHNQFTGPEAGIAKVSPATTRIITLPVLAGNSSVAVTGLHFLLQVDTGSPPAGHGLSMSSVLRV
jgi:hypothetical protein